MTRKAKIRVLCVITVLMAIGFSMMFTKQLYVPCMILTVVWVFHIYYFTCRVKRCTQEEGR